MPGKVTEALQSWEEAGMQAKNRSRWGIVPTSTWQTIWKERNTRCFENIEHSMQTIKVNCSLILCFG